jgi:hypothetical protein
MRKKLVSRLSGYWKMEAANVIGVPLLAWVTLRASDSAVTAWVASAMVACSGLLVIGAAAWRMELAQLQGERALAAKLLRWLGPSRPLGIALAVLGAVAGVAEWLRAGGFTGPAIAAAVLGLLAVLEYVNYYEVQLQHFDHAADFKRLITGKGFRKAHLARAVENWRAPKA